MRRGWALLRICHLWRRRLQGACLTLRRPDLSLQAARRRNSETHPKEVRFCVAIDKSLTKAREAGDRNSNAQAAVFTISLSHGNGTNRFSASQTQLCSRASALGSTKSPHTAIRCMAVLHIDPEKVR